MVVPWVLLLAAVVAAVRLRDTSLLVVAIAVVAVELVTLRRTQRMSTRFARALPFGRRAHQAKRADLLYVVAAVAGLVLLGWSFVG